ncbi:MAG: ABC transporter permease [Proteobacteria bacterium]|nr:ABC transporter permease [Pseudomonadota bacterium]
MKRTLLNLKIAFGSLGNFKLRTALATLGVFFGTLSLVVVGNLSDSLALKTEQEIANLGNNLIIVVSGQIRRYGPNTPLISRATNLTLGDAEAIVESLPAAARVSPSGFKAFPVRRGNTVLKAIAVNGVTPDFSEVRNFEIAEGSPLTEEDDRLQRKVALIGRTTADKLFGEENPVGKTILIWRVPCQIIGVMAEKGADIAGNDQDNQLFVPLKTFLRNFVNKENVNIIYVQAVSAEAIDPLRGEIEALLRVRHGIRKDMKDDFSVVDLKEVTALKNQAMDLISVLGRIAAAAAFLIGALGILSIMILIVNERRVEIGIRRAVGSRKRDIILQFLMESSFISVSGGAIGMAAGLLMSLAIAWVLRYPASISVRGLLMAFAASVASGILAGIYPSLKATTIHPVDIIRSKG